MARPTKGNYNDITGNGLVTKAATDAYRSGYDLIWGNKKKEGDSADLEEPSNLQIEDEASSQ
jgi:hypothetical protein